MKRILILIAALITLIASQSFAQISPTDRLAVNSGVSLWMSSWKSAGNVAQAKLEPLYGKNVVTYSATAADQVKRSWAEFANVIRERSADFAAVVAAQKGEPQVTVDRDRLVTSFSSGVRLVWEKTNGVWRIVEQNLPATQNSMTALAE